MVHAIGRSTLWIALRAGALEIIEPFALLVSKLLGAG